MWHVIDLRNDTDFWVERRLLFDQLLELWARNPKRRPIRNSARVTPRKWPGEIN